MKFAIYWGAVAYFYFYFFDRVSYYDISTKNCFVMIGKRAKKQKSKIADNFKIFS